MDVLRPPDTFQTERLSLRPVSTDDVSAIFEYASNEQATKFMNFVRHRTVSEAQAFVHRCMECWGNGHAFPWAVLVTETKTFAGVFELRINPPKADFGYILNRSVWGHGYATEATSAIVGWAIAQPTIFRVWATCHPHNRGSIRVLEKSGLHLEAKLTNWEARPNLGEPAGESLVYALMRPSIP